jgi:hypothetical protein
MSKRNQRWGKAIDAIRATGKHGATAIDIGNAVLGTHGISARDREAYGLALGTRLVRLKMATVLANNRFVMTRPDTRDEEKTYADELRNQPFTSMVRRKSKLPTVDVDRWHRSSSAYSVKRAPQRAVSTGRQSVRQLS